MFGETGGARGLVLVLKKLKLGGVLEAIELHTTQSVDGGLIVVYLDHNSCRLASQKEFQECPSASFSARFHLGIRPFLRVYPKSIFAMRCTSS